MYLWMFGLTLHPSKRGFLVVFYVFLLYLFGNFYTLVTLLGMGLITQQKVSYTGPYSATAVQALFKSSLWITHFFISNAFFVIQPQCCLTFSWIELQMLLRCCLIHKSITIMRRFLYLLYLCPCLDLVLFMSYLCDLFFFFFSIFIMINCTISRIQTDLFFLHTF